MATRTAPPRSRTQAQTNDDGVLCSGHKKPARKFQAGPQSKNPGRWFYTCALARDDPQRCKFFQWADEGEATSASTSNPPSASKDAANPPAGGGREIGGGRTLGGKPLFSPRAPRIGLQAAALANAANLGGAPRTPTKARGTGDADEPVEVFSDEEIDWRSVDADAIEREAEVRSPHASQRSGAEVTPVRARLEAVAGDKRKRDDEDEVTPKRGTNNPFLTTTPGVPDTPSRAQGVLAPTFSALADVAEHLARKDRLVRAAETMKKSMRATIKNLQDRVDELERQLKEEKAKNG